MISQLTRMIKRLFCRHPTVRFVRNIYGDEIRTYGYKRSIWQCKKCGAMVYKGFVNSTPPGQPGIQVEQQRS